MAKRILMMLSAVVVVFQFQARAQQCPSKFDVNLTLNDAGHGDVQSLLNKKDKTGLCFEAGNFEGFVRASQQRAKSCGVSEFVKECDSLRQKMRSLCGEQGAGPDFFDQFRSVYYEAVDCVDNARKASTSTESVRSSLDSTK